MQRVWECMLCARDDDSSRRLGLNVVLPNATCRQVAELDSDICAGVVSRAQAAVFASPGYFDTNGLLLALLTADHGKTCACIAVVLSWGTCPHALLRLRDWTYTPLWWCMQRWSVGPPWPSLPVFLAHGAVPAPGIEHKGPDNALRPTLQVGTSNHRWPLSAMTVMHRQWVAWHCRCSRRWWVALHV
jgi:hypothetical protein